MTRLPRMFSLAACSMVLAGCSPTEITSIPNPNTRIDASKVFNPTEGTWFTIRITLFVYHQADTNGWPADPALQEYVRFLQDRDIPIGFMQSVGEDGQYLAMFKSGQVRDIIVANEAAEAAGIELPPTLPGSVTADSPPSQ